MDINYTFELSENDPTDCYHINRYFTKKEIDLISLGIQEIPYEQGGIGGSISNEIISTVRESKLKWLYDSSENPSWYWLYEKLYTACLEANNTLWKFDISRMPRAIQYAEYLGSTKDKYEWHQDIGKGTISTRKISITVQLTQENEYEGGNLEINCGVNHILICPKEQGTISIFPSYMLHRVTPVTKGIRKSLVLWVEGCHFK